MSAGVLSKLAIDLASPAKYALVLDENPIDLTRFIGKPITLRYEGKIICQGCARTTKKSYSGGYCFPCSQKLARCDLCIVKPERCHHHKGTCREPEWGNIHCMIPHIVYLANTSGLKVGITRKTQVPTRWLDQGAMEALPIFEVKTRRIAGLIEIALAKHVSDKTNWRTLLKMDSVPIDLKAQQNALCNEIESDISAIQETFGLDSVSSLDESPISIQYPIDDYPEKIVSLGFDKHPEIKGTLIGMKGQYLILNTGVVNIRKHTGYRIHFEG